MAEHGRRFFLALSSGLANFDTALETALKRPLATATRVNLRFYYRQSRPCGESLVRKGPDLCGGAADRARGNIDPALAEELLGLILV